MKMRNVIDNQHNMQAEIKTKYLCKMIKNFPLRNNLGKITDRVNEATL